MKYFDVIKDERLPYVKGSCCLLGNCNCQSEHNQFYYFKTTFKYKDVVCENCELKLRPFQKNSVQVFLLFFSFCTKRFFLQDHLLKCAVLYIIEKMTRVNIR